MILVFCKKYFHQQHKHSTNNTYKQTNHQICFLKFCTNISKSHVYIRQNSFALHNNNNQRYTCNYFFVSRAINAHST